MNPNAQNERFSATVNAWKSKLLDLSKRNRALNFKVNIVSTVTIVDELPTEIFKLLCGQKKSLKFKPSDEPETKTEKDVLEANVLSDEIEISPSMREFEGQLSLFTPYKTENLTANYTDDFLQTNSSAEKLDKSLRRLEEQGRTIVEEQGVNALFLALGMLYYKESKDSELFFKAPLILIPVELHRKSAREGFVIKATDEEIVVNPSLIEYLQRDYKIALPEIDTSDENYDLQDFFSVAQLLDSEAANFDLILFDEASQLPTEDAVGAIIRGRQLVVVGDPKQLPPTNFFAVASGQVNVQTDEDGLPLFDDSQSILEEVMSSGVPSSRLKWHYRSAHESLITFSNVSFYDSDLYTFPSVETDAYDSGLHFEFVPEGVYEGKGLNMAEARKVADAVVEHAKKNPQVSLGVGTFNMRQQLAIQDELEQRRREDPSLEPFFDRSKKEPFFVKNLENIQGDERDVIFLSVTYAKAHDGRLRYNFGPLNGENGWRRMNVLTTRARKLMRVFSSIKAEDINLAATASRGAKLLRDFLAYAEHKRLDSPIISAVNETDSPFEREVFQELERRGLSLIPQVGVSGYKIDFGVLDDAAQGKFICGIECDGVAYHSSETARDRDRLRQQVLEARGWEIHRVWSTDWFKDRNGQIERLLGLIEQSRQHARQESEQEIERKTFLESESERQAREFLGNLNETEIVNAFEKLEQKEYIRPIAEPYQMAQIDIGFSFQSLLEATTQQIAKVIMMIVEQEAPIHIKDVFTRTSAAWEQKAGSNITARIMEVLRLLEQAKHIETRGEFVWKIGGEIRVRSRNNIPTQAERIAPEEIRAAILLILRGSHKFYKKDLINEIRAIFGFNRTGASLQQVLEQAVNDLLSEGIIGEGSTGIGLRQ